MKFDLERVKANAADAETEDLLDRVTVYRDGMEPEALDVLERELMSRGVTPGQIDDHARRRLEEGSRIGEQSAAMCWRCRRPAIAVGWGWHRLFGALPLFPRKFAYCAEHKP